MGMPGYTNPVGYGSGAIANRYAGFWLRFLALIIDGFVVGIPLWILQSILFAVMGINALAILSRLGPNPDPGQAIAAFSGLIGILVILWPIEICAHWLYSALMESSVKQATVGKMVLSLRVTDLNGQRISFGRASGRFFAKWISTLTLCIGYVIAGFTERKQALHDFIAGTLVWKNQ